VGESSPGRFPGNGAEPNGEASVRIVSYRAQRLALEVDAAQAALIATSVTAWPGWKLTMDGAPAPLAPYNHAFLAFRVTRGRHTAVLRYWPDSFAAGGAISAAALAISVLLLTLRRRRSAQA
jgi:uncharacterized membrane protein YfhO